MSKDILDMIADLGLKNLYLHRVGSSPDNTSWVLVVGDYTATSGHVFHGRTPYQCVRACAIAYGKVPAYSVGTHVRLDDDMIVRITREQHGEGHERAYGCVSLDGKLDFRLKPERIVCAVIQTWIDLEDDDEES